MRYGIFSDVHANGEALDAVLTSLRNDRVDCYLFLGDIVGYGGSPQECIERLRGLIEQKQCFVVAGNHDGAVCGMTDTVNFNYYAQQAVEWTQAVLPVSDKIFLKNMPLVVCDKTFYAVHASLIEPHRWHYVRTIREASANIAMLDKYVCFFGHTHRPELFVARERVERNTLRTITFEKKNRYLINVGSVGQPRDRDPRASYGIYDSRTRTFTFKRVPYDVRSAQKKILAADLPPFLAQRLRVGE